MGGEVARRLGARSGESARAAYLRALRGISDGKLVVLEQTPLPEAQWAPGETKSAAKREKPAAEAASEAKPETHPQGPAANLVRDRLSRPLPGASKSEEENAAALRAAGIKVVD